LGHDIPSTNLVNFYKSVLQLCQQSNGNSDVCPSPSEKEFFEKFVGPVASQHPIFVVITTTFARSVTYVEIVSHEIMHGQYFLLAPYRATVDTFWKGMAEQDKQRVRQLLSGYDTTNDFVMRNEFQAYLLMAGGENEQLGSMIPKFRAPLTQALNQAGTPPIQVIGHGFMVSPEARAVPHKL
jgi:hypothetical protein